MSSITKPLVQKALFIEGHGSFFLDYKKIDF
ncbi:MAG: hypothetical protein ACJAS4_003775 [Bacteriovoracaceae bacterium]|jgi:hypothetical protein